MTEIVAFRDRVIQTIRQEIPQFRQVTWTDGAFDEKDLDDVIVNTPSAFVAVMAGRGEYHSTGEINVDLTMAVYIVTEDKGVQLEAENKAWAFATEVAKLAAWNRWSDDNVGVAENIRIEPIRDPDIRRKRTAIVTLMFNQCITLGTNSAASSTFLGVYSVPQSLDVSAQYNLFDDSGPGYSENVTVPGEQ